MRRTRDRRRSARQRISRGRAGARLRRASLIAALACACSAVLAQQQRHSAYQVEAIYLYNFSRFVQWPAQASLAKRQSFDICVLGSDPFGAALDSTIAGETIAGRNLAAKRISSPQEVSGCQILFVSTSEASRLKEIIAALDRESVLTVSDIPGFSQRGGMIQFVPVDGKVRFEVNIKNAANAGLTLSSDLLEVALAVRKDS